MDKEEFWSKFGVKGQKNHVSFEYLVLELFKVKFQVESIEKKTDKIISFDFSESKLTRDGNKDQEMNININNLVNHTIWGECKFHKPSISLKEFSPTLVMGFINNIQTIVLFSKSKINRVHDMEKFCKKSNIQLIIYDDDTLIELISSNIHNPEISKYFEGLNLTKPIDITKSSNKKTKTNSKQQTAKMSYTTEIIKSNNLKATENTRFSVNDCFTLEIRIENKSANDHLSAKIELEGESFNKYLEYNFVNEEIFIPCASSHISNIKFKIKKFSDVIELPKFKITINDKKTYCINDKKINCTWLLEVPLIGSSNVNLVSTISDKILNADYCVDIISGKSGVGKSRIIKELLNSNFLTNIGTLHINCEYNKINVSTLFKEIVKKIYNLQSIYEDENEMFFDAESIVSFDDNLKKRSIKLLFENTEQTSITTYAEITYELIKNGELCLILDNVQFLDKDAVQYLDELLTFATKSGNKSSLKLILIYNTDYLYKNTSNFQLFNRLLFLTKEFSNFSHYTIEDFTRDNAIQFLNEIFNNYPLIMTFDKIIDAVGTNPFNLEQILLLLYQKDILARTNDFLFVKDANRLQNEILSIPNDVEIAINNRLELIQKNPENRKLYPAIEYEISEIIKSLLFFKAYNNDFANKLNLNIELLDLLVETKFISITDSYMYTFYHSIVERALDKNFYHKIEFQKYYYFLKENNLNNHKVYKYPYFIGMIYSNNLDFSIIEKNLKEYKKNKVSIDIRLKYDAALIYLIENNDLCDDFNDTSLLLKSYLKLCKESSWYTNYNNASKRFDICYNTFETDKEEFYDYGYDYFDFVNGYINLLISIHDEENALIVLQRSFLDIDNFKFNTDEKKYVLSNLHNRYAVYFRRINNKEKSSKELDIAIELAEEISDCNQLIKHYIDYGRLFLYDYRDREEVVYWFTKAYKLAENREFVTDSYYFRTLYYKAVVNMINKNYDDVYDSIEIGLEYFRQVNHAHYIMEYKILESSFVILFWLENDKFLNNVNIEKMLIDLEDLCISYGSQSKLVSVRRLKYIYYNSSKCYEKCISSLLVFIMSSGVIYKKIYIPQEIGIILRNSIKPIKKFDDYKSIISIINKSNNDDYELIKKIINMDESSFNNYMKNEFFKYTICSTNNINLPI